MYIVFVVMMYVVFVIQNENQKNYLLEALSRVMIIFVIHANVSKQTQSLVCLLHHKLFPQDWYEHYES